MSSLSLSLECSFLDLTNEDSGYESPTSSDDEDQPLDSQILPLPLKKTKQSSFRNIYHNEPAVGSDWYQVDQNLGETSMLVGLALSDIPWPLPGYETWMNPVPVDLPKHVPTTSFSTRASRLVTFEATRPASLNELRKSHHTGSAYSTPEPGFENVIGMRQKKGPSPTVQKRQRLEALRGSARSSLQPFPASEKTNSPLRTLLITHTAPFVTRTEIKTSPPVENKTESVIGGSFSIEILPPSSFSKQALPKTPTETAKIVPSVSIITLEEQGEKKSTSYQSVKRHHSMKNNLETHSDGLSRKKSTLEVNNRPRTRTSSADSDHKNNKENLPNVVQFPIKRMLSTKSTIPINPGHVEQISIKS